MFRCCRTEKFRPLPEPRECNHSIPIQRQMPFPGFGLTASDLDILLFKIHVLPPEASRLSLVFRLSRYRTPATVMSMCHESSRLWIMVVLKIYK